ncbi:hypothetical protein [Mesorhizobium sp. M0243]|uniref:hypothetical protein n=1 Tax=Mesorhizobium sp. M0243 TaxID=2956925 RepID=UPI00333B06EB
MRFLFLALFMVLATHVSAQEAQGVAGESPSVGKPQPAATDDSAANGKNQGFPVTIVESPEQATHSEDREKDSASHEAADLEAQRRAADAAERSAATAERQEIPAWTQIWLAIVGTVIAIVALFIGTWNSIVGIRTTRAQLRAYLSVFNFDSVVTDKPEPDIRVQVTFKNAGQTPAQNVRVNMEWELAPPPFQEEKHFAAIVTVDGRGSVGPGMSFFAASRQQP